MVSKIFEKLVRHVNHFEKIALFHDFQFGFRTSLSTADLLIVVSDRIPRALNGSGAIRAVTLDISKTFDRVWLAGLFRNSSLTEFQVGYFALICNFFVIDGSKWFWVDDLHKSIQLRLVFFKVPFLVLHFSCYTRMTFLMMFFVILLSVLMILLCTLIVIRHRFVAITRPGIWAWIWPTRH